MFRLESRFVLIILLVVASIISIVSIFTIVKISIHELEFRYNAKVDIVDQLQERLGKLELELSKLSLPRQLEAFNYKQNIPEVDETAEEYGLQQPILAPSFGTRRNIDPLLDQRQKKRANIFVEASEQASFETGEQFYKTFSSTNTAANHNGEAVEHQLFGVNNDDLFNYVKKLPKSRRKRILVTGGAGFVGSHLVDSLMLDGHEVIVCDDFFTGRKSNIEHWQGHPNFELIDHDIINPLTIEVNEIYHLASPASPVHYMSNPIKTIKTNSIGTINVLGLAKRVGARILIASTSEIYGDPKEHPQSESYWGNANPIGPRSCYDESKRLSESLAVAYNWRENVSIAIARIFNTYGPRMHPNDGRVVSNFLIQAINNQPLTVYGSGNQTRSFQYVSDLVLGLKKLMESNVTNPINLGNPNELTIQGLAFQVKQLIPNCSSVIIFDKLPIDDPHQRRPDIRKAELLLGWKPIVTLLDGLKRTGEYFIQEINSA